MKGMKKVFIGVAASSMLLASSQVAMAVAVAEPTPAKNVFIMISDGASFGAWDAGDLYTAGSATSSSYFGTGFDKYLMTTYPLNMSNTPTNNTTQMVSYNPAQAWGLASYSSGGYIHQNAVDSAAAGTAISTGQKTYNNAMNWSNLNEAIMPTLPEYAKANGKVVGTISSVQWSHATPAAFSDAHDISRNNYAAIANDMLGGNVMDVIMGAGNPFFTDNGTLRTPTSSNYQYVGGQTTWEALNAGTHNGWQSIQTKSDFEALANNDLTVLDGKTRLVGTAQVATTLQQSRSGYSHTDTVNGDAFNANVPTLEIMTKAALNVLNSLDKGNGMFLQIEGGAIDWAAHANQTSRLVEEQIDFNNSVNTVIAWIEANGGWENNLLIVTTDHGNSMPSGESSNTIAHERLTLDNINAGTYTGSNPNGVRWWSGSHTNELVPLFVRGAGSELFASLVDGTDTYFGTYYTDWAAKGFDGRYVDQTDIFTVMQAASTNPVPVPGSVFMLVSGLIALAGIGRRRA